ncbi:MAG: glycosyltransferase family 4 protein [Candidatus Eiseniibacteriota bacterium]
MNATARDLKVLLVGPVPPPHGGMANQTLQLAHLLRGEGATVELVETNAPYRPAWATKLPGLRAGFRLLPYLGRLWSAAGRANVAHVMANSGWAWHLFVAPAVWVASLRGVPVVLNYRGGGAGDFFRASMLWVRPTLARCRAVIVPSAFLERIFREHGVQAEVVPNIVDLTRFAPVPGAESGAAIPAPRLVVARNLEPIYDVGTAIRAFGIVRRSLPNAHLVVAGSGPSLEALERLCEELGIRDGVEFTGRLENEKMAELYRGAAVALNPSLADNMPISILEALASGVPVVSTDVGGIPDLVTSGVTAILVPPGNSEAMAAATLDLLSNSGRRSAQVLAGLDRVRHFAWGEVKQRLLATYARVIGLPG